VIVVDCASSMAALDVSVSSPGASDASEENLGYARVITWDKAGSRPMRVDLESGHGSGGRGSRDDDTVFGESSEGWGRRSKTPLSDGAFQPSRRRFLTPATGFFESTLLHQWFPDNPFARRYHMADLPDNCLSRWIGWWARP